jgi:uncharacterized repeat protein (TIGR01451 family)
VAALNYITQAEICFQALAGAGVEPAAGQPVMIDEGGLSPYTGEISPLYLTSGLKWGAGSPFYPYGPETPGPQLPGGVVTYSYMPTGSFIVSGSDPQWGGQVWDVRTLPGVTGCIEAEIEAAFAAWAAVANIQFQEVADSNTGGGEAGSFGDIRIGAHFMDGTSSSGTILAHAFYPPFSFSPASISGDLHFDVDEPWSCTSGSNRVDIGVVALHEVGHTLGLGHENLAFAVMGPYYNPFLTSLQLDDIEGVIAIYGTPAPELQLSLEVLPFPILSETATIDYVITLQNRGSVDISGAVITNDIPEETEFVSAGQSGGETFAGSGTLIWPGATLPANSTLQRHFRVEVTLPLETGDQLTDTVSVSAPVIGVEAAQFIQIVNPQLFYLPLVRK